MLCTKLPFWISFKIRFSFRKISIDGKAISPINSYVGSATLNDSMHGFEFALNVNRMDRNAYYNVSETLLLKFSGPIHLDQMLIEAILKCVGIIHSFNL